MLPNALTAIEPYLVLMNKVENVFSASTYKLQRPKQESLFNSLVSVATEQSSVKGSKVSQHIDRLLTNSNIRKMPAYLMGQLKGSRGDQNSRQYTSFRFRNDVSGKEIEIKVYLFATTFKNQKQSVAIIFTDQQLDTGISLNNFGVEPAIRRTAWVIGGELLDRYYVELSNINGIDTSLKRLSQFFTFTEATNAPFPIVCTARSVDYLNNEHSKHDTPPNPKGYTFIKMETEQVTPNMLIESPQAGVQGKKILVTEAPSIFRLGDVEDQRVFRESALSCTYRIMNLEPSTSNLLINSEGSQKQYTMQTYVSSDDEGSRQSAVDKYQKVISRKRKLQSHDSSDEENGKTVEKEPRIEIKVKHFSKSCSMRVFKFY